jgi:uncharacterized phage protein (TIGR02218 family)
MKTASTATQAIIESGFYLKIEFWKITLVGGTSYYFTAGDIPLTVSGNTYKTGLIFVRDQITTKVGLKPSTLDLTVGVQFDNPGGQPQIAGGNFLAQCAAGILDGATWLMSKGFFNQPAPGQQIDTSPGLVPWWSGITNSIIAGRSSADITLDEATAYLNVMMPRNMIQAGCVHTLFDAGCTVPKANNTYTGTISAVTGGNALTLSSLASSFADHYFDQGIISFTSGVLSGVSFTVQSSAHASTLVTIKTILPFPTAPSAGDSYSIIPGCDKTVGQCVGKFRNSSNVVTSFLQFYRGCPFVPNPETLYDGGTGSQTYSSIGTQGRPGGGSSFSGK